jgi:hypothetical protein
MNQVKSEITSTRLKKKDQITKFTSQSRDTSKTQQRAMKDFYKNKKEEYKKRLNAKILQ